MAVAASIVVLSAIILISGCASTGNRKLAKTDPLSLSRLITRGKTTSSEIKSHFGDPNDIDFTPEGNPKWIYLHIRNTPKVSNFIPIISWFVTGTNDTTKKLVVIFRKDSIVKDYLVIEGKGETKTGFFG